MSLPSFYSHVAFLCRERFQRHIENKPNIHTARIFISRKGLTRRKGRCLVPQYWQRKIKWLAVPRLATSRPVVPGLRPPSINHRRHITTRRHRVAKDRYLALRLWYGHDRIRTHIWSVAARLHRRYIGPELFRSYGP
jgi:hypothetical protein